MTLEQLLARAKEIEQAILNTTGQLNSLHGHKAETDHWIKQLQQPEEEPVTPPEKPQKKTK